MSKTSLEHLLIGFEIDKLDADGALIGVMDYLKSGDAIAWHRVAQTWNWGWPLQPLKWIIDQPECDQGTALTLFWYSEPGYCLLQPEQDRSKQDFLFPLYILERWKMKAFRNNVIAFPGPGDLSDSGTNDHWIGHRQSAYQLSQGVPGLEIPIDMVAQRPGLNIPKDDELFWR